MSDLEIVSKPCPNCGCERWIIKFEMVWTKLSGFVPYTTGECFECGMRYGIYEE